MDKKKEVKLAKKGTLMYDFQEERTEALTEMFNNPDKYGIYPTSEFFVRLDNFVDTLINQTIEDCAKILRNSTLTVRRKFHDQDFLDGIVIEVKHKWEDEILAIRGLKE